MAHQKEFTFAQDAFVQVRLKERNQKVKPSATDGLFFCFFITIMTKKTLELLPRSRFDIKF